MKPVMATLVGGPCDGEEVEVVGCDYQHRFGRFIHSRPTEWYDAIYTWDEWNESKGKAIGVFKGYYRGATRVDRLGRRLNNKVTK